MKDKERLILQTEAKDTLRCIRKAETDEEALEIIGFLMRKHYSEGYNDGYNEGYEIGYDHGEEDGSFPFRSGWN